VVIDIHEVNWLFFFFIFPQFIASVELVGTVRWTSKSSTVPVEEVALVKRHVLEIIQSIIEISFLHELTG
jgi:hypothetical protein